MGILPFRKRSSADGFERAFRVHAPMVHGVLLAFVPQPEAEDLLQDVFLRAMEHAEKHGAPSPLGPWLATVARNRAIDFLRTRRDTVPFPVELSVTDPRRAEVREVLAAIRALPEAYREPLVLRLVEGMTAAEISEQCGLTPESVRVNLHRGMQKLRERLGVEVSHGG